MARNDNTPVFYYLFYYLLSIFSTETRAPSIFSLWKFEQLILNKIIKTVATDF